MKTQWELVGVEKTEEGTFLLTYETPEGRKTLSTKTVVLTVPSYIASGILRPISVRTAHSLFRSSSQRSLFLIGLSAHIECYLPCSVQLGAGEALDRFYYPPVAAVTISYPKLAIKEDRLVGGELKGFGQLHPRSQGIQTLGNEQ